MSFLGALTGSDTADAIAAGSQMQQEAALRSEAEMRRQYEQGRQDLAPWLQSGRAALTDYTALMGLGGDTAGAMRALQRSPGYQFRLNQGTSNLNAGLAARGGMGSGRAFEAGQRYVQDYASGEYGNRLNQLAGLSGQGQASAAGQAVSGQQLGQNLSGLWQGAANAGSAAGIAGAQAHQSGLTGLAQLGLAGYGLYTGMPKSPSVTSPNKWSYNYAA